MEKAANPFLYVGEEVMMKKCICLLWLLMAVCFCSPAGAETGLYFLSWDMDGDAVCYALEVTTEDGEVLYADDSVWQNEVIFPADISSEAEEKIFWRVRPFDLYGGPLHGWTEREPFDAAGSFLEREAPLLRPDNHEDRRMKLLYPVYSYVGLPGAKSYEVEVTDSEPENPDGTEPSMYRVWSGTSEIMEIYDDFPVRACTGGGYGALMKTEMPSVCGARRGEWKCLLTDGKRGSSATASATAEDGCLFRRLMRCTIWAFILTSRR